MNRRYYVQIYDLYENNVIVENRSHAHGAQSLFFPLFVFSNVAKESAQLQLFHGSPLYTVGLNQEQLIGVKPFEPLRSMQNFGNLISLEITAYDIFGDYSCKKCGLIVDYTSFWLKKKVNSIFYYWRDDGEEECIINLVEYMQIEKILRL
ncbi:hypothetical protein BDA99DRAFT_537658 [Phascolomyces articulosus]|uniref:Uncharacterized protein n=1 Tax=Phascolomyces articulosus TaxID=60185 RepID=A0AAD5K033_9FUNG|nr:hypothetical protein BDA99DRAFT_537658 [Phascolomyces articulosus]